jgi:hypothetical protein
LGIDGRYGLVGDIHETNAQKHVPALENDSRAAVDHETRQNRGCRVQEVLAPPRHGFLQLALLGILLGTDGLHPCVERLGLSSEGFDLHRGPAGSEGALLGCQLLAQTLVLVRKGVGASAKILADALSKARFGQKAIHVDGQYGTLDLSHRKVVLCDGRPGSQPQKRGSYPGMKETAHQN